MTREEAEKLANEMLSHYGKQSWDEHFKVEATIDDPSNYTRIKSVDAFAALLLRRGYPLETTNNGYDTVLYKAKVIDTAFTDEFFMYQTIAEIARQLDCLVSQHHCCCAQCKEPLLQKEVRMIGIPERVFEPGYQLEPKRYKYRSAKAGPSSPVLTDCPGCSVVLSSEKVGEIQDVE